MLLATLYYDEPAGARLATPTPGIGNKLSQATHERYILYAVWSWEVVNIALIVISPTHWHIWHGNKAGSWETVRLVLAASFLLLKSPIIYRLLLNFCRKTQGMEVEVVDA
jgi:hypothetical protein